MANRSLPLDAFRLDGRVALITGASSGLGTRFARVLTSVGARVVITARRADRLAELAAEIPGAVPVACDIADAGDTASMFERAVETCGRIDLLVNNAGTSDGNAAAENETIEEFDRVVAVNQRAVFQLSTLAARGMIERGAGCIVNIASIHGLVAAAPNAQAAYVASKAAVIGMTRELALQWAKHGVRVNALAPAYFETELTTDMFANDKSLAWIKRNTPMQRPGKIDELDGALLYLASDASSYVTGSTLVVDGGWTAR